MLSALDCWPFRQKRIFSYLWNLNVKQQQQDTFHFLSEHVNGPGTCSEVSYLGHWNQEVAHGKIQMLKSLCTEIMSDVIPFLYASNNLSNWKKHLKPWFLSGKKCHGVTHQYASLHIVHVNRCIIHSTAWCVLCFSESVRFLTSAFFSLLRSWGAVVLVHGLLCSRLDMAHFAEEFWLQQLGSFLWKEIEGGHRKGPWGTIWRSSRISIIMNIGIWEYWKYVIWILSEQSDLDLHGQHLADFVFEAEQRRWTILWVMLLGPQRCWYQKFAQLLWNFIFSEKCHGHNALEVILKEDAVVPGGFVGSLLAREDAEERRLQVLQEIWGKPCGEDVSNISERRRKMCNHIGPKQNKKP